MRKKYSDIVEPLLSGRAPGRTQNWGASRYQRMEMVNRCRRGRGRADKNSIGRTAQLERAFVLGGLRLGFGFDRFEPAALNARRLDACGNFGVRCADRTGVFRRTQRAWPRN